MASDQLIKLTADIVSAHVSNNSVAVADVASLVQQVYASLDRLGSPAQAPEEEKREPMVSARSSVKPDHIVCMICGSKNKMLKRHLQTEHGLMPEQYRAEFNLRPDYPMVAPNYSERRRALAHSIGLGRKKSTEGQAKAVPGKRGKASSAAKLRGRKKDAASAPEEQGS